MFFSFLDKFQTLKPLKKKQELKFKNLCHLEQPLVCDGCLIMIVYSVQAVEMRLQYFVDVTIVVIVVDCFVIGVHQMRCQSRSLDMIQMFECVIYAICTKLIHLHHLFQILKFQHHRHQMLINKTYNCLSTS